jgi:CRISPR-associated protein Csm1
VLGCRRRETRFIRSIADRYDPSVMSLQVFLQARLLGAEQFLAAQTGEAESTFELIGRGAWLTLVGEVLPRALLAELKLSRMLLGSSSAEQFLLVLAEEEIPRATEFLDATAERIAKLSAGILRLEWASTENLGAWPVVRKRLDDALERRLCCPLSAEAGRAAELFQPFTPEQTEAAASPFEAFAQDIISAQAIGWAAEEPLLLTWDNGTHQWRLSEHSTAEEDTILFPRRFAMDEDGGKPASTRELAERAEGADRWGVLCGDVDHFEIQLRRAASVEDHIHFSALFKEFFAGELAVLCALPEFWRKVSVLYRGGDDFVVLGSWDALILFARELERLYERFAEQHLSALPGVEAKTISMALVLAPDLESPPGPLLTEAEVELRATKSNELGSLHLFGRTLEWKRLNDAEELKETLVRLVRDFRYPPEYLNELAAVYRETVTRAARRSKAQRVDKPWRTYMRLSRVIPPPRGKEQTSVRNAVITNLIGKRTAGLKLRPSGRVGLEWARLEASA